MKIITFLILAVILSACTEVEEVSNIEEVVTQEDLWLGEAVMEEGEYPDSGPCDKRMIICIDPDNVFEEKEIKYYEVFDRDVMDYCDSIGLFIQMWSGDLSGAEISMFNDGISVDLSPYQDKGLGYLLCLNEDWDSEGEDPGYNFMFVSHGNTNNIISEIDKYFEGEVFD